MWERAADEAFDAFEARVIGDASAVGLKSVVIGGLPPDSANLGSLEELLSAFEFPKVPPEPNLVTGMSIVASRR